MDTRQEILNNIREYTSDQLAEAIRNGQITLYELSKTGYLTPMMRKRIEQNLAINVSVTQTADVEMQAMHSNIDKSPSEHEVPMIVSDEPEETGHISHHEHDSLYKSVETMHEKSQTNTEYLSNKGMFLRPFSFKGRIRRLEFGLSYLIYWGWYVLSEILMTDPDPSWAALLFVLLPLLPLFWFLFAQGCKRCHDLGHSGWLQLIPFYVLWMIFLKGDVETNKYGDNPKTIK